MGPLWPGDLVEPCRWACKHKNGRKEGHNPYRAATPTWRHKRLNGRRNGHNPYRAETPTPQGAEHEEAEKKEVAPGWIEIYSIPCAGRP